MTNLISRINITLPKELVSDLKRNVPKRKRSRLIATVLEERLVSMKREKGLKRLKGSWDRAAGINFSSDKELSSWRKSIWASMEGRFGKK